MANVSYLKTPARTSVTRAPASPGTAPRRRRRGPLFAGLGVLLLLLGGAAAVGIVFGTSKAKLSADPSAIAAIDKPLGGATIESVSVVTGPHSKPVPVTVSGGRILPTGTVPANERLSVRVVVKRPGWIGWLAGKRQTLAMTMTTPTASLRSHFLTAAHGQPLRLHFKTPVRVVSWGGAHRMHRHVLAHPQTVVALPRTSDAGTTLVSAQIQPWETSARTAISWFPAGSRAGAVASPAPGSTIKPGTPITLTFSEPVSKALDGHMPDLSPATPGTWHKLSAHAIQFRPTGSGYGLAAKVNIGLPSGVVLTGGQRNGSASTGQWTVPNGSQARLLQLLAGLGYLPLKFEYASAKARPALTPTAQENAAVKPPAGHFVWRYPNTPAALKAEWAPSSRLVMLKGALMRFEDAHGMTADGIAGAAVWKQLIDDGVHSRQVKGGYTYVYVHLGSQQLELWNNGRTVISGAAINSGAAGTPTASGTYPVFEHIPVTTMSGTNPDGSHYSDPGIQYVSYFNGGDALHAFTRAQYGLPQSLGCVEEPLATAAKVYPYTPIGTLVHVA